MPQKELLIIGGAAALLLLASKGKLPGMTPKPTMPAVPPAPTGTLMDLYSGSTWTPWGDPSMCWELFGLSYPDPRYNCADSIPGGGRVGGRTGGSHGGVRG